MLQSAGMAAEPSRYASEVFLRASLRHTGHHDITYLPERLELLNSGTMNPKGEMELLSDNPVFSRWDGHGALGEYCCGYMLYRTMEKAKTFGVALGTVRHSNHFLAGHPYGQIAAERNCMALIWSNTDPCMGDPEGEARVIGNNPLGFGAPDGSNPLVLDLCMAYASLGNLATYAAEGQSIPPWWGRDGEGNFTGDPAKVLKDGITLPVGRHKGFGFALMAELLTGGLSGGEMGQQIVPVRGWQKHSQTVLVIDLEQTGALEDWQKRIQAMREEMSAKLGHPVRFPGDHLYREASLDRRALHIPEETYEKLRDYSLSRGLSVPAR